MFFGEKVCHFIILNTYSKFPPAFPSLSPSRGTAFASVIAPNQVSVPIKVIDIFAPPFSTG